MRENMVNLKEVIDKLHNVLDKCEKDMGYEEIEELCDCIDILATISARLRKIGLALYHAKT